MNELYCLNEMYTDLGNIARCIHCIHEEFIVPLWIIAIAIVIAVVVWLVLGIFSAMTLVKLQRKVQLEIKEIQRKDIKKKLNTMKKIAKQRKEETEMKEVTVYKNYRILVSDKNQEGKSGYIVKKGRRTFPLIFATVDEAEDYIDLLLSK